ncbi:hypothetical protein [Actinomadura sp. K4S16]|uniref:hypothetical protein n=1 Tax=Actinomadura sp. K4S16 TaxID=1316147 RepID=UPI001359909E|nr:hypothetical protein [Actinomadura sp. K4S16]
MAEELSYSLRRRTVLRSARLQRFFEYSVRDQSTTIEQMLQEVTRDDLKAELLFRAIEAAKDSISEIKLQVLARAFATGAFAADEAVVDQSILIVEAISQLEAHHLRVLNILCGESTTHFDSSGAPVEEPVASELRNCWSDEQIAQADPGVAAVVNALTARLNNLGMLHDDSRSRLGIDVALWRLTVFGQACANELHRLGTQSGG